MEYALLTAKFPNKDINIGDYIQAVAARQFLPKPPSYIYREALDQYAGPAVKLIANAWYMHNPQCWPPASNITPLLTSIHLDHEAAEIMLQGKGRKFFEAHAPIGCRDLTTKRILDEAGIAAYFSGCLTLTLGQTYKRTNPSDKIYLVDEFIKLPTKQDTFQSFKKFRRSLRNKTFFNTHLRQEILDSLLDGVDGEIECVQHEFRPEGNVTEEELFSLADTLLTKYANAKLVITSRIHCALPCIGMGTPVIFINEDFSGSSHTSRFDGLLDFFHKVTIDKQFNITKDFEFTVKEQLAGNEFNKRLHLPYVDALCAKCREFVI